MFPILCIQRHIPNGGLYAFTYIQESTGFGGKRGIYIVKMSVIHVREAEMSWALNLHTARSTEVPVCTVLLFLMMGISDRRKILLGLSSGRKNTPKEII